MKFQRDELGSLVLSIAIGLAAWAWLLTELGAALRWPVVT